MSEDRNPNTESPDVKNDVSSGAESLWNLLGLQISRKTEFIALAAFLLSMGGLLWQATLLVRGATVTLFPTDQIVLTATDKLGRNYAGQDNLLALVATMAYVNEGDVGRNAVVRREYINFSLGDRSIEHRWYEFGSSDVLDGKFTFKRDSESRPFVVNAGSARSHETLFTAWEVDCEQAPKGCDPRANFVAWDDFLKFIKSKKQLSFTTSAEVYSSSRIAATCVVRLRDWEIAILEKEQWLAAACVEPNPSAPTQRRAQPQQSAPATPK